MSGGAVVVLTKDGGSAIIMIDRAVAVRLFLDLVAQVLVALCQFAVVRIVVGGGVVGDVMTKAAEQGDS
jgi:hypothetical protein